MKTVNMHEAKTNLPRLVAEVESGEGLVNRHKGRKIPSRHWRTRRRPDQSAGNS